MDLITVCKYLMGGNEEQRLLPALLTDRTRRNEHKLKHKTFYLNTKKPLFIARVIKQWNKMPNEAVEFPFAEVFKILTL